MAYMVDQIWEVRSFGVDTSMTWSAIPSACNEIKVIHHNYIFTYIYAVKFSYMMNDHWMTIVGVSVRPRASLPPTPQNPRHLSRSTTCCVTSVFAFAAFISPQSQAIGKCRVVDGGRINGCWGISTLHGSGWGEKCIGKWLGIHW